MARFPNQLKAAAAGHKSRFPSSGYTTAGAARRRAFRASQMSDFGTSSAAASAALDEMASIVARLGDDLANRAPTLPGANSAFAILTHCLEVIDYWLGHVLLCRPNRRNREAEFTAKGDVETVLARVAHTKARMCADLAQASSSGSRSAKAAAELNLRHATVEDVVIHVLKELHQHLGHIEITRDLIMAQTSATGSPDPVPEPAYTQEFRGLTTEKEENIVMDFRSAARQLVELSHVPLEALWMDFWAEGGDANILELDAYINHQIRLPSNDAVCLDTVVKRIKVNRRELRS